MDDRRFTPSPFCGVLRLEISVCVFFIFVLDKMEQKWTIAGLTFRPFVWFCVWKNLDVFFFIFVLDLSFSLSRFFPSRAHFIRAPMPFVPSPGLAHTFHPVR